MQGKGCLSNIDCNFDEYCEKDQMKCVKNCVESPCGPYSKCSPIDHAEFCSCIEGYFPGNKKGCREKEISDVLPADLSCDKFCGKNSSCKIINDFISCYCIRPDFGNPFKKCQTEIIVKEETLKPTGEVPLSLACALACTYG